MSRSFTTFESNVLFALRFMIDHDVVGGNWVELPAGHHTFQGPDHKHKLSHCQMEAHVHCSKIISHKPEGTALSSNSMPKLNTQSWQIMCLPRSREASEAPHHALTLQHTVLLDVGC